MRDLLSRFFRSAVKLGRERSRISAETWPSAVYAIGDVHGCASELSVLEAAIVDDSADIIGNKWIVMLGDYVDRGPRSADVLDHLCQRPPAGFQRFCLAGNHETMLLDFLADPHSDSSWLRYGGRETLASYGIDTDAFARLRTKAQRAVLDSHIPIEHRNLLEALPASLSLPGVTFVHAGLRPGIAYEAQLEDDMMWIREPFLSSESNEFGLVVHGHTPVVVPDVRANRIGIDTGAFATGILTAVRLSPHATPAYLSTAWTPDKAASDANG